MKKRIEYLSQEERNEMGAAMAKGMEKARVEAWNNALASLVHQLGDGVKGSELTTVQSCIDVANSLMMDEDDEPDQH